MNGVRIRNPDWLSRFVVIVRSYLFKAVADFRRQVKKISLSYRDHPAMKQRDDHFQKTIDDSPLFG